MDATDISDLELKEVYSLISDSIENDNLNKGIIEKIESDYEAYDDGYLNYDYSDYSSDSGYSENSDDSGSVDIIPITPFEMQHDISAEEAYR